jgi:transcriptional regulator with XRE-family HTH domain
MMISINREEVNALLRKRQGTRSLRAFAITLGVSVAYLSDILRGNREPGPKILKTLKIRKTKTVSYRYEKVA